MKKHSAAALNLVNACKEKLRGHDEHIHAANCGHKSYVHNGHVCYEHDGHYHYTHEDHAHACSGPFATANKPVAKSAPTNAKVVSINNAKKGRNQ